mmetsp:Transcript_50434/g.151892  ORF Transcript_50434/g.151892 Transcript_50434/m.151892 type:complete len:238 (-) Transcript_50434:50-763(-)
MIVTAATFSMSSLWAVEKTSPPSFSHLATFSPFPSPFPSPSAFDEEGAKAAHAEADGAMVLAAVWKTSSLFLPFPEQTSAAAASAGGSFTSASTGFPPSSTPAPAAAAAAVSPLTLAARFSPQDLHRRSLAFFFSCALAKSFLVRSERLHLSTHFMVPPPAAEAASALAASFFLLFFFSILALAWASRSMAALASWDLRRASTARSSALRTASGFPPPSTDSSAATVIALPDYKHTN